MPIPMPFKKKKKFGKDFYQDLVELCETYNFKNEIVDGGVMIYFNEPHTGSKK